MTLRILLSLCFIVTLIARADAPPITAHDLPRPKPLSVEESIKSFKLHPGLRIEAAACEPQICSPVAMCFDEDSRLYVVEMRDYPDLRDQKLGRIVLLESTKNDGFYDKSTVFADGLQWPSSVCCYDGGIFVCASPDIFYFKDTHHAGKADLKKLIFTGFGPAHGEKLNVQGLVNGLTFRPDGRIYGTTSENGGVVTCPDHPEVPPLDLRDKGFSFDPRKLDLRAENGGGQYGITWDDFGREYVCSNSHEIQTFLYDSRYAERNPAYAMPPALVDLAGPAGEVFRISPEEAWRVIRTQWRTSGAVPGLIEGGGRASGYFTSATGICVYRGDAMPLEFRRNAFVAEPAGNLVSRRVLEEAGIAIKPVAERAPEEKEVEFLASPDLFFRPVQVSNGPDGALYVIDMYREVIEHPWSLPDNMRNLLDLHSGADRGRIWRVTASSSKREPLPKLSINSTEKLIALLGSPNAWVQDAAARLIAERHEATASELLKNAEFDPIADARAWPYKTQLLACFGALDEAYLRRGLHICSPVTPGVLRASEPVLSSSGALVEDIAKLIQSNGPGEIEFQLALSIGFADQSKRLPILTALAKRDADKPLLRAAIINSAYGIESELCAAIATDPSTSDLVRELAGIIAARGKAADLEVLIKLADDRFAAVDRTAAFSLLAAIREGQLHAKLPPAENAPILTAAVVAAKDASAAEPTRLAALKLLGTTQFQENGQTLLALLDPHQPQAIQSAAVTALGKFNDPELAPALLKIFRQLSPQLRSEVLGLLIQRPDRAMILLNGIPAKQIQSQDIPSPQQSFLRSHRDPKVRQLARKLLVPPATGRDEIIEQFHPALSLKGDAAKGKLIYEQRCISCHRLAGEGSAVGPDLTTVRAAGKEKMLVNIIDPNREVAPNFMAYIVETNSGESLTGIVVNETAASLTVRQAFGKETVVLRSDLKRMASQKLSLMPEGVEAGLSNQNFADLLEFLSTASADKP